MGVALTPERHPLTSAHPAYIYATRQIACTAVRTPRGSGSMERRQAPFPDTATHWESLQAPRHMTVASLIRP